MTRNVVVACKYYFGCKIVDQVKASAPHIWGRNRNTGPIHWLNGKRLNMPFAEAMIWHEPTNHFSDCYFV